MNKEQRLRTELARPLYAAMTDQECLDELTALDKFVDTKMTVDDIFDKIIDLPEFYTLVDDEVSKVNGKTGENKRDKIVDLFAGFTEPNINGQNFRMTVLAYFGTEGGPTMDNLNAACTGSRLQEIGLNKPTLHQIAQARKV